MELRKAQQNNHNKLINSKIKNTLIESHPTFVPGLFPKSAILGTAWEGIGNLTGRRLEEEMVKSVRFSFLC